MTTFPQARLTYGASESGAHMFAMSDREMDRVRRRAQAGKVFSPSEYARRREAPGAKSKNHTMLKTGHIVTVEPELYNFEMDSVRLEAVVLDTKMGCNNLVRIPEILEV